MLRWSAVQWQAVGNRIMGLVSQFSIVAGSKGFTMEACQHWIDMQWFWPLKATYGYMEKGSCDGMDGCAHTQHCTIGDKES